MRENEEWIQVNITNTYMNTHHRSLYYWICDGNTRNNIYVNITFICMYIISCIQYIRYIFFYLIFRVWPNKKKKIHCNNSLIWFIWRKKKKPFRYFITILLGSIFSNLYTHILTFIWAFVPTKNFTILFIPFGNLFVFHSFIQSLRLTSFCWKEQKKKCERIFHYSIYAF